MRKTSIILGVLLSVSAFAAPLAAYAQTTPSASASNCPGGQINYSPTGAIVCTQNTSSGTTKVTTTQTSLNTGKPIAGSQNTGTDECGWLNPKQCILDLPAYLLQWVVDAVYWILFLLVWFAASMLDFTVQQFVIQMGHYVTAANAQGIQTAWAIVRDLANIGIIGGLITVAISTILQIQNYGAQKFLARLIIAALLVNFSYFFAGAIIDSSNYLATQIYSDMISRSGSSCAVGSCTLTSTFMNAVNFQNVRDTLKKNDTGILSTAVQTKASDTGNATFLHPPTSSPWLQLWVDILSIVFELVTIFIFLSALALLTGRFVVLILLLITSPLGVAGIAIPFVNKYAQQWWGILFAQAFFAPVYFLLLDISFIVISQSKGEIMDASGSFGQQVLGTALTFFVASVFMLVSLRAAKSMSESGKQYFGDIYKGLEKANWAPRAYTNLLKATEKGVQGFAGTHTLGYVADRGGRAYERWMSKAPEGSFRKRLASTALDRSIQRGFNSVAGAKFGGRVGYVETLEEKEKRQARLSEVQKFAEALTKKPKLDAKKAAAQEQHDALRKEYGEVDAEGKKGVRAGIEDKLAMAKFGKQFNELTNEQKAEVMKEAEWGKTYSDLDGLAMKKYKKGWNALNNEDRAKLTEEMRKNGEWRGRNWVKDKATGTYGWETGFPYYDDLRRKIDLRDDKAKGVDRDALAMKEYGKKYAELGENEQEKIKEKDNKNNKFILQDTIDNQKTAMSEVSWGIIKEQQLRNGGTLKDLTPMLSSEQYLEAMADKTISKTEKNEMREKRVGTVMGETAKFNGDVKDLDEWEKMTPEERKGKVLRGSAEYDAYRWALHENLKKNVPSDEIVDFVESDLGVKTGMRKNRLFNDAMTNGVYRKLQESKKISSGEKRAMRGQKRTRYTNAIDEDEQANKLFNEIQEDAAQERFHKTYKDLNREERAQVQIAERSRDTQGRDEFAMEKFGKKYNELSDAQQKQLDEGALSFEEFNKIYTDRVAQGRTREAKLLKAAWLRKRAETAAEKYFGGKNPTEVSTEVKQEDFGTRLGGKYMRREQFLASKETKDQSWRDKQAHAMAVNGSAREVDWLLNASDGQNNRVDWEQVDKDRAEAGLPSVQQELDTLKGARTTQEEIRDELGNDVGAAGAIQTITERNAAAAGRTAPAGGGTSDVAKRIQNVLAAVPEEQGGIENILPDADTRSEEVDQIVDELPPAQLAELPNDVLVNIRFASSLDRRQVKALLESNVLSPRTRRTLIQNILQRNKKNDVVEWLATNEGKNLAR